MENLYDILGVSIDNDEKEIKRAYALKLREFPPEKDEYMFKKIKQAYDILSDSKKRMEYDFEIEYGEKLKKLEEEINTFWEEKDYKNVIKSCKEILSINNELYEYLYKLVLALDITYQLEESLMYALRLVKISDDYLYKKEVAKLFFKKRDFKSSLKYLKLAYEQEPLDDSIVNLILDICKNTRDYRELVRFFDSQIKSTKSEAINAVHFDSLIRICIIKEDVKLLKSTLEKIDKFTIRNDKDKIRLGLDLYDKSLKLYDKRNFQLSRMLAKKAKTLYEHEEIEKLYDLSNKNYKEEKLYNEFVLDRKIVDEIKDIIFLYKGPNATKDTDYIYDVKNDRIDKIKNRIIKNPNPIVTSIKALKFRYYDYYTIDEELFEKVLDISQERKILYDQFNDLSFNYNICYTIRKLMSFYESNIKDEISDLKRDNLFSKTLEELEEERPEDIILSVRIMRDDYFKVYEIIPEILEEIKNNAKERMIIYYNPVDYEEIKNDKIKQVVCMFYMGVVFYFIASLKTIYGFLDFIISTFNISSSQMLILILITVFLGVYIYKSKKNENCIDERE